MIRISGLEVAMAQAAFPVGVEGKQRSRESVNVVVFWRQQNVTVFSGNWDKVKLPKDCT